MAFDIPDGPSPVITVEVVGTTVKTPEAATEYPIDSYGTVSHASSSYNTVFTRTVPAGRVGVLRAIEIACDNYDVAQWRVTIKGVAVMEDEKTPDSLTLGMCDLRLAAASVILVEGKSDGATTINFYAAVDYKEVS